MDANNRTFKLLAFAKKVVMQTVPFSALFYVNGQGDTYVDGSGNVYVSGSGNGDAFFFELNAKKVNFTFTGWSKNG